MDIYDFLVKDDGGACTLEKLNNIMDKYIKNNNVKKILEIGVYNGCFLLPIANTFKNIECIGIDPYSTYIQNDIVDKNLYQSVKNMTTNQLFLSSVYERLIYNITNFDLNNVKIIKDFSYNVDIDDNIDIAHIDGNHDYISVLSDLDKLKNKININGIIIMDDVDWKSVYFAMLGFLYYNKNYMIIEENKSYNILKRLY